MIYKASSNLTEKLLSLPESGMGYQVVTPHGKTDKWIAVNAQFLVAYKDKMLRPDLILKDAIGVPLIDFDPDSLTLNKSGAIDGPLIKAPGNSSNRHFRLSAYFDDLRVDKSNARLLPGSYTTNYSDFLTMTTNRTMLQQNIPSPGAVVDPIERYALPNSSPIKWIFVIAPKKGDQYRQGTVQPAFNRSGGGIEFLFENGTSDGTLTDTEEFF